MLDQSEGAMAQQSGEVVEEELGVAHDDFYCSSKASKISLLSSETFHFTHSLLHRPHPTGQAESRPALIIFIWVDPVV
jgi:hypothetical protein